MGRKAKITYEKKLETIIKDKMRLLDDFGICKSDNSGMIEKLKAVAASKPDKDPQVVLDLYCRPMILQKMDSWD